MFALFQSMEEALAYLEQKSRNGEPDHNAMAMMDNIIQAFSTILDLEQTNNINLDDVYKTKFYDLLILIPESIDHKDIESFQHNIACIIEAFSAMKRHMQNHNMYKLVLYGQDQVFLELINYGLAEVTSFNSLSAFDPLQCDYLILLEQLEPEHVSLMDRSKIFNFAAHANYNIGWEFYQYYYKYLDSNKNFEGLITGLSYLEKGISEKHLDKDFFNFAGPGQDLFYDYQVFQYVLHQEEQARYLKYVIIGLAYYSFHYDMSLSSPRERTNYYYPIFGEFHHYPKAEVMKSFYHTHLEIGTEILEDDYLRKYFELTKEPLLNKVAEIRKYELDSRLLSGEQKFEVKLSARKELTKYYPLTVKENQQILKQMLDLAVKFEIKPILLICPTAKIYSENLPQKVKEEFLGIISDLKIDYQFQFLDLFDSSLFQDSDFFNPSHLNDHGAMKLSKLLNELIEW